jgi:hypothetical protein
MTPRQSCCSSIVVESDCARSSMQRLLCLFIRLIRISDRVLFNQLSAIIFVFVFFLRFTLWRIPWWIV